MDGWGSSSFFISTRKETKDEDCRRGHMRYAARDHEVSSKSRVAALNSAAPPLLSFSPLCFARGCRRLTPPLYATPPTAHLTIAGLLAAPARRCAATLGTCHGLLRAKAGSFRNFVHRTICLCTVGEGTLAAWSLPCGPSALSWAGQ